MKFDTLMRALVLSLALTPAAEAAQPQSALTPETTVRLQLEALRDNDHPEKDAGIATVFAFASPPNRAQTGPLNRFVKMIHGNYADLIDHREARLLKTQFEDAQAIQPVEVISRSGVRYRYLFILRQYTLPQGRCWLTDGVIGKPAEAQRSAAWTQQKLTVE